MMYEHLTTHIKLVQHPSSSTSRKASLSVWIPHHSILTTYSLFLARQLELPQVRSFKLGEPTNHCQFLVNCCVLRLGVGTLLIVPHDSYLSFSIPFLPSLPSLFFSVSFFSVSFVFFFVVFVFDIVHCPLSCSSYVAKEHVIVSYTYYS
jgi:hypothetical protein